MYNIHHILHIIYYAPFILGLQKIKNFWPIPCVLLFLDANSKSRHFRRYIQQPVVGFISSACNLEFGIGSHKQGRCAHRHTCSSNLPSSPSFIQRLNSVRAVEKKAKCSIFPFLLHFVKKKKKTFRTMWPSFAICRRLMFFCRRFEIYWRRFEG